MQSAIGKKADQTHASIEQSILKQAIWLDDFFGKVNPAKKQQTGYLLRFRNGLRIGQSGSQSISTDIRLDLALPKVDERLRLMISGGNEPDQLNPRLPEDPGNPGFDRTFQTSTRIVNTELRYSLIRNSSTDFFLGAGIGLILPPNVFARSRYQYTHRLSDLYLFRFAETAFVKTPVGFGETTEVGLERSLNPKTVLRLSSAGTVSQEIHGAVEWGTELALLHEISSRSAITVAAGIYGNTGIADWISNYRIYSTYRRNFLRPWLFYELEPQISWPRQSDAKFPTTFVFTARIEVVFQAKSKHFNLPDEPKVKHDLLQH